MNKDISSNLEKLANIKLLSLDVDGVLTDGGIYYDLYKQDDTTYVFLERYKDQEAQDAHGKTDYFRELGSQMGPFMAGAPEIKVLQSV